MITRREQEMLDLADAGLKPEEIADRMQIGEKTVRGALARLSCTDGTAATRLEATMGSAALLAAIARHHPERITA